MTNLTIVVDEQVLRRARFRALEQGTSVNAVLRAYLEAYAGADSVARQALDRFLERAERATSGSGPEGRRWTREELHDRAGLR